MTLPPDLHPPLDGIKVLDLSRMFPGAFCTLLLADLGADVVKVEAARGGDGLRGLVPPGVFNASHTALNRGKRSIIVDLRSDHAADVLTPLVEWADVVVESNRPGQLDEMGIGFEAMRLVNPKLVWCSLSGFGATGPNATAPGHDITYLGCAGVLDGLSEGATTPPAFTVALPLAASMGTTAILAALLRATTSGVGAKLDISITDSAMWMVSEDVAREANAPGPGWGTIAARNVYRCADGREVTVAATEPRPWAALCAALGAEDVAGHRLGMDPEAPVVARLTELFATAPAAQWVADPGLAGGVGPVNTPAELLDDPQVTERDSLVTLDGSDLRVLANPIRIDGASGSDATRARGAAPDLGQHTDAVLAEIGIPSDTVATLRASNTIG